MTVPVPDDGICAGSGAGVADDNGDGVVDCEDACLVAKALRLEMKLTVPPRRLVVDLADAGRVFERHPLGSGEVEKLRRRRWVPARAEGHLDLVVAHEIEAALDVVGPAHLIIDVLDSRLVKRK